MEARPEFTVIAGPNGAGKSRLCFYYIHCDSFDGDLLALNLRKEHPEWKERWIGGTVAGELQKQKDNAITLQKDFAFETNFSNDLVMQRKMFGGHDVADEIIEYNFDEGIKRMQQNLHLFDNITFIDGNTNFGEVVAIYIKKSAKHEVAKRSYSWFNQFFAEAFEKLRS